MDMDMGSMSGMGGMDMSSTSMFTPANKRIAQIYWYLVAAAVGILVLTRMIDLLRLRLAQRQPGVIPFRPENLFAQTYDTMIAVCREISYPQIWTFTGKYSRFFTPPPLGRCLLLLIYWTVILTMLWSNTILGPSSANYAYRWEIVGFRAAWVSVTQLPLIYILSGKVNIISILTGISYERLNWLHRWVARTIFLTLIVHWSFFFREWDIAHFVKLEMDMMPMVKYGFGAWAVIGWVVLSGFGFFRSACYELWFLQHLIAAIVLLWLVYVHVPIYARYNVWSSVGVVVLDRLVRTLRTVVINCRLSPSRKGGNQIRRRRIGYDAEVKCLSSEFIHVTVRDVNFSWQPGQHIYLTIPRAGPFEAHPFTIANVSRLSSPQDKSDRLELYIRVHQGFTRRLYRLCQGSERTPTFLSFISGPWGVPTSIGRFESLILVATGNGASFTVPIFQQASMTTTHLRQISFIWIIPDSRHLAWFRDQLLSAAGSALLRNINVSVHVFVTRPGRDSNPQSLEGNPLLEHKYEINCPEAEAASEGPQGSKQAILSREPSTEKDFSHNGQEASSLWTSSASNDSPTIILGTGRPDLDTLIRPVVEEAFGETGIFACGGAQFTDSMRNYVASLSDERAVHKGTAAQGLYLFCETYGW
ncbi:hypothetical protein A1O3_03153 [Capronia epimyces CBS 606.96]|uniref:ferric-chelate reductase (NADPH) n=1 Tax=Capronia epimyces CBS 606.96 TaxID=1182542 RepID=W9Z6G1_9EURO|nr:uncharacterized protein A1O3_03153 [Capronia epimyces CBS 606.96]EXJ90084.1 hypothetical protein A1O3_03153 [Capronia epimyces CBS 606.96]